MVDDKLQDECGIIGFWNRDNFDVAELLYLGLYGIQHRGQQSAGAAINDGGKIVYHKELGLVSEVFNEIVVRHLGNGKAGIAHVGYNTTAENLRENTQPFVFRYTKGQMAISYNGCLLNAPALRLELEQSGYVFQSSSDAEIIACLISRQRVKSHSIEESLIQVMKIISGAYSILIMTPHKIVAVRDSKGMKPLCFGKLDNSFVFCSESAGLDTIGAKMIRDIVPGEIVVADNDGIRSLLTKTAEKTAMCIFEFVYLARTDSYIDGISVYEARFEAGKKLALECPVDADVVMGVPDSGVTAALGYALQSGLPYAEGLMKNRYIGRTFIQPSQESRELAVGLKLNPIKSQLEGKRVVLIDDSIVRGTTSKKIVQMLKEVGGAKEVHMRISSPPVKYPCHYGIDTPDKNMLIANQMSKEEIAELIGADSLGFISIDALAETPVGAKCSFCYACFNGNYPLENREGHIDE